MFIGLLYVLTVVTWVASGRVKPSWTKAQFEEFEKDMTDQSNGGVSEFRFLDHKDEIEGEIGNIKAEWKKPTRDKWETRVNHLLANAKPKLPSLTSPGSKPSYIWVGVGSTTSQAFYVIKGGPPTAIEKDTQGNTFGFLFGSKDGVEPSDAVAQTIKATAFLKLLSDKRRQIAKDNELEPYDIPIFFAKSIAFALKKNPYPGPAKDWPKGEFSMYTARRYNRLENEMTFRKRQRAHRVVGRSEVSAAAQHKEGRRVDEQKWHTVKNNVAEQKFYVAEHHHEDA